MLDFMVEHRAHGMAAPSGKELAFFRMLLELSERRESPPRCLGCGSLEFEYLVDESGRTSTVEHPRCGGVIRSVGLLLGGWDAPPERYYSTEGIRIDDLAAIERAVLIDVDHEDC